MSQKRFAENDDKGSKKPRKYNLWDLSAESLTPPSTPKEEKSGYNMWKVGAVKTLKIAELKFGACNGSIVFRVSLKSFKKPSVNGEMFHFHAFDGTEIQITAFPEETKKFFGVVRMNKTFELKKFQVKPEKKDFPTGTDNSYYICLTSESELTEVNDENIPSLEYDVAKFTKIDKLASMNVNSNCDVLAIMCEDLGQQTTSNGKLKQEIGLTDDTKECIKLTLWGDQFDQIDFSKPFPMIIRKGVLTEYCGEKHLKVGRLTAIWFDAQVDCAINLKKWFDQELKNLKM